MMLASLSRSQTSGITIVLSTRGFLNTLGHPAPPDPVDQKEGHARHSPYSRAPLPVKLQLLSHKQGGYSIRILRNEEKASSRAPAVINEEISELSVLRHTAEQFDFVLSSDGSRHVMSFSNVREGQHFLAIFTAVKEQPKMANSAKRMMAMAAKFPGVERLLGSGGGNPQNEPEQKVEQDTTKRPVNLGRAEDIDVYTLVECLKASIAEGDEANAVLCAKNLANLKPKLSILVETSGGSPSMKEDISLQVQVEDRQASKLKLRMSVPPNITIAGLKKITLLTYDLPVQIQNWIIDGKIMKDNDSLVSNGITSSGATLYLYLTSAEKVGISKQDMETEKHALVEKNKTQRKKTSRDAPSGQWSHRPEGPRRRAMQDRVIPPSHDNIASRDQLRSMSMAHTLRTSGERTGAMSMGSGSGHPLRGSSDPMAVPADSRPVEKSLASASDVGWSCPMCTLVNPPLIPGCQACMTERPKDYQLPEKGSYLPDPSENVYLQGMEQNERALKQMKERQQMQNYQDLLQIDGQDLVPNKEPFECPVCLSEMQEGEGVVLRECLHTCCTECLREHVKQSADAMVTCPSMEDGIPCNEPILEREIKALLPEEEYNKYHDRSLRQAESGAANSFHCKTANCKGFCFYEDDNNFFLCPLCKRTNCLTCKAIHEGINCKQYQEDLKIRAENDVAAKQTQNALQALVSSGEAMHCPHCNIVVQKKGGCDWLRCSVCQTEICWVTKQARWGSGGSGDTSGGCRCRVNGQKCHPNCHNCH